MRIDEIVLTSRETVGFYGVTKTTLANWVSNGFPRVARNQYPLKASFTWWRANIANDQLDAMRKAKLRREEAKAQIAELDAKEKGGSLIDRGQAISWLSQIISEAKSNFRNLPYRVSPVVVGQDEKMIFLILRREIDNVLRTLAGAEKPKVVEVAPWDLELVRCGIIKGNDQGEVVLITASPPFRKKVRVSDIVKETEDASVNPTVDQGEA